MQDFAKQVKEAWAWKIKGSIHMTKLVENMGEEDLSKILHCL